MGAILAESEMTAFETETVESCKSPGVVPADVFRPSPSLRSAGMCQKRSSIAQVPESATSYIPRNRLLLSD